MTLTPANRGSGAHNTSATSFTLNVSTNCTAGAMVLLCVGSDNANTAGAAFSTFTVTDTAGNTWVRQVTPLYDPGAANAGVTGAWFTTNQDVGTVTTSVTITVTFNTAATAKSWCAFEVTASAGGVPVVVGSGVNAGAGTGTPTVTTSTIDNGDAVFGAGFSESTDTWAGDADTTNGSWSTHQHNGAGSGATGMATTAQYKVVTATATQTYNPTLTSADCILCYVIIHEARDPGWPGAWW